MTGLLVAGVDSSTQSCKVVVCRADTGEVVRQARAAHPDGTQVHPQRWWEALDQATAGGLLDGVAAVSVGGQQHGMVLLDEHDEVVRDALLWNDTRSAGEARDLVDELGGPAAWAERIGVVPVASITATKLRWVARAEPDVAARAASVVLPHDWLSGRLLGAARPEGGWTTDRGDASGTGYWSSRAQAYDKAVLRAAFGRDLGVPQVLGPAEAAGTTPTGRLVAAGTGDNMAAALALDLADGDVVVSLGTSGTVYARALTCPDDPSGMVAGFADATGAWLPLVGTLNAARVLDATARLLGVDLAELDRLALAAEPGAGGLVHLPFLDGERSPDLPEATGTLAGMTRANLTPTNLARAAVEGMLCGLAMGLDALRGQGITPGRVLLIGGAAASQSVRQVAAQVVDLPVSVPASAEYVGLGAARQAAWALSGAENPPLWRVPVRTVVEPPADSSAGQAVRDRYADLLHALHGIG